MYMVILFFLISIGYIVKYILFFIVKKLLLMNILGGLE